MSAQTKLQKYIEINLIEVSEEGTACNVIHLNIINGFFNLDCRVKQNSTTMFSLRLKLFKLS